MSAIRERCRVCPVPTLCEQGAEQGTRLEEDLQMRRPHFLVQKLYFFEIYGVYTRTREEARD